MSPHSRYDWQQRIKSVELDYQLAVRAGQFYLDAIRREPFLIPKNFKVRDVQSMIDRIEGTYLIRLFAAFEAGLRTYWATLRETVPPSRDLIDGVSALRRMNASVRESVHEVRRFRNALVHDADDYDDPISVTVARRQLQVFFSHLPDDW